MNTLIVKYINKLIDTFEKKAFIYLDTTSEEEVPEEIEKSRLEGLQKIADELNRVLILHWTPADGDIPIDKDYSDCPLIL